ncbi:MAG: hypothetical protein LC126_10835 [Bryobacterales bacterium]|nr:hypothetical protein [Bryobacterales bacterium]
MRIAAFLAALLFLLAACSIARLAWAARFFELAQPADLQRAALLAPLDAAYQYAAGNARRAVQLNPYFSRAWMRLGFEAELRGDFAEAERFLLQAARVDATMEPRWALANYYLRRGDSARFWPWFRLAAERSHGGRAALFQLAWRMTNDGGEVLRRGIPPQRDILASYVQFLLEREKLDWAAAAARPLLEIAAPAERNLLLLLCDRLITAQKATGALRVWNGMVERGLLPHGKLSPTQGVSLTNPRLEAEPLGRAFDWRLLWRAGVHSTWAGRLRQIRIELDGKEGEQTGLIAQVVPVMKGQPYEFCYRFRTEGLAVNSGVGWRVYDPEAGRPLETTAASLSSPEWREGKVRFSPTGELVRLELAYQRASGTVRQEGTVILDGAFRLERTR